MNGHDRKVAQFGLAEIRLLQGEPFVNIRKCNREKSQENSIQNIKIANELTYKFRKRL